MPININAVATQYVDDLRAANYETPGEVPAEVTDQVERNDVFAAILTLIIADEALFEADLSSALEALSSLKTRIEQIRQLSMEDFTV